MFSALSRVIPALFAKSAIMDAIEAEISIVVAITEGIPQHDMLYVKINQETFYTKCFKLINLYYYQIFIIYRMPLFLILKNL